MKILVLTQKVDFADPILGFFHNWLMELASNFQEMRVICLEAGQFSLPANVKLLSLGKESGASRFKYLFRFYKYIWQERKNYDVVFVHMNQEYVLLAGWLWYFLGKKIFLWRNHPRGNFLTKLAIMLSDKVFCTSDKSFTAIYRKTVLLPVGIDTDSWQADSGVPKIPRSILALGRISEIKRLKYLIEALIQLKAKAVPFKATIVGSAISILDKQYERSLKDKAQSLIKSGDLEFVSAVSQSEAISFYQSHQIYVNLTPVGSMDKTIFEAMACELPVIINNQKTIVGLATTITKSLDLSQAEKNKQGKINRRQVEKQHSLKLLVSSLVRILKT